MKKETIDAIRDLAIGYEKTDLTVAYELMEIAGKYRNGPVINQKLKEYKTHLAYEQGNQSRLDCLVANGDIAVIPIGFRCHTKLEITRLTGIDQASMPFDSGFFPPDSVSKIIRAGSVSLKYDDHGSTHAVCVKTEDYNDPELGLGIQFLSSSYEEIEELVEKSNEGTMKKYLDSTFGYYTLDKDKGYVLAHYNWHRLAPAEKSKGITDPVLNLEIATKMMNKRIQRVFDLVKSAKYTFFVFGEFQKYKFMQVDEKISDVQDLSDIEMAIQECLTQNYKIINIDEIKSASTFIEAFDEFESSIS